MNTSKKVLILCYDFPPLNTVGALRPFSWYKELNAFGVFPIIVTRSWPTGIVNQNQKFSLVDSPKEITETSTGLVIKAGFKPNFKNRLIAKHGFNRFVLLRKVLSAANNLLSPYLNNVDEYHFLYVEARSFLKANNVDLIIATGNPFGLFKEASKLSKEFNTPWMPDYRDPFSNNVNSSGNIFGWLLKKYNRFLEKKWTKNAIHFTSVSQPFIDQIAPIISKDGSLIHNGFDQGALEKKSYVKGDKFVVSYLGTVYNTRFLKILIEGITHFLNNSDALENSQFQFIGSALNETEGTQKLFDLQKAFPKNIILIDSCENKVALKIIAQSSLVINLNYGSFSKGVIPVKLYEYMALSKTILCLEEVQKDQLGGFEKYLNLVSEQSTFNKELQHIYEDWKMGKSLENPVGQEFIEQYSRSNQAKVLADLIHRIV